MTCPRVIHDPATVRIGAAVLRYNNEVLSRMARATQGREGWWCAILSVLLTDQSVRTDVPAILTRMNNHLMRA